jgi:hypothetical protein
VRRFWPPAEAAQADYERLRAAVLAGAPLAEPASVRFSRGGLGALIARPAADPVFIAIVAGAPRPAWTPHVDPRLEALAAGYALLLANTDDQQNETQEVAQ